MSSELKPQPNEVWITKEGRTVLVVFDACRPDRVGFIWYDPSDNTLTFTPLDIQVEKKTDLTVAEWGCVMAELVRVI